MVYDLILFSKKLVLPLTKWMKKKTFTQLQAKCSGEKGTFPKEETKW
jgi:hypothetical protein